MVINLCSERSYDPRNFQNRVKLFPFDDHNPPPLRMILSLCQAVQARPRPAHLAETPRRARPLAVSPRRAAQEYLDEDAANVVVLHCKAGKGRTGTMICSYLLYCLEFNEAEASLAWYGAVRTHNKQGVTIPSQRRYVRYTAQLLPVLGLGPAGERSPGSPAAAPLGVPAEPKLPEATVYLRQARHLPHPPLRRRGPRPCFRAPPPRPRPRPPPLTSGRCASPRCPPSTPRARSPFSKSRRPRRHDLPAPPPRPLGSPSPPRPLAASRRRCAGGQDPLEEALLVHRAALLPARVADGGRRRRSAQVDTREGREAQGLEQQAGEPPPPQTSPARTASNTLLLHHLLQVHHRPLVCRRRR